MLKTVLVPLTLILVLVATNSHSPFISFKKISNGSANRSQPNKNGIDNSASGVKPNGEMQTGVLEKMMVADGNAQMRIDLNRLTGIESKGKLSTLRFSLTPNAFFTVLVFNKNLRGPEPGAVALLPRDSSAKLPALLSASFNQLVIEKTDWSERFDLVVRDSKTGFIFFNIEGNLYDYDPGAQLLSITEGRLLISEEFAAKLGRKEDAGALVGKISITATMRPIEVNYIVDGEVTAADMPSTPRQDALVPGPDVIVGDLSSLQQFGSSGTQVGLAVATDSCNAGAEPLHWFALPQNDHPVIPQNLYRMSGGAGNDERFEQIGQSWLKHAFTALQNNICNFGCTPSGTGTLLGAGCSDPYSASLNAGQSSLGSRAWVNPFTGAYPGSSPNPNNHSGHTHTGTSHRILVEISDLNTTLNPGATYYAESQYVTPHEYAWCQTHPGQCNQYNNASYRRFNVSGTTSFSFSAVGSTVQSKSAVTAWPGASIVVLEPAPGVDGLAFVAYKVTNPLPGIWHYEYAIYNQNLDRAIQSFSLPLPSGIVLTNIGFHAPPQPAAFLNDGTVGSAGFSSTPWTATQDPSSLTWASETFAQNQNANAVRWGTLYNFRFDTDRPPDTANATIGFFKTGSPVQALIQVPSGGNPTPTPTPTPIPTPTPGDFSLSLNGTSAYVNVPSSPTLNIGSALTVEAWVKTNSASTQQGIIERYDWTPGAGGYGLRITAAGKPAFFTIRNDSQLDFLEGPSALTPGVWNHVAGVYDGSQLRLYVNGSLVGSLSATVVPLNGNGSLKIGARGDDATFKFNGLIDEARLSAAALYTTNFTPDVDPGASASTRGLWKFDAQDASDTSGNNNHGALNGGAAFSSDVPPGGPPPTPTPTPSPSPTPTPGGFSLSLNGSTSYIDVPSNVTLNVGSAITVEAWVKTNSASTQQGIIERYDWTPSAGGYGLRLTNAGRPAFFTIRNDSQLDFLESPTTLTPGQWYHLAGVYDGSQLRLYVNGGLVASLAASSVPLNGNGSLKIGARGDDASFKFNGLIDEGRVTASAVYTANFTPDTHLTGGASTRGLWKFDSQDGSDNSGNNNNGTLIGGAAFSTDVPSGGPPPTPTPTPTPGNFSLSLNGSTGYANVPSSPTLNIGSAITVEAWVKTNSVFTQQGIIERYDWTPAAGGYGLRLMPGGTVAFFTVRNDSQVDFLQSPSVMSIGQWYHIAGVYDGAQLRLYVNGSLAASMAATIVPLAGNGSLKIGARGDDATFKFNGLIDEARVSASALYTTNFTPDPHLLAGASTRGLWKFDLQDASDTSGNNNNGALVGGAAFSTDVPGSGPIPPSAMFRGLAEWARQSLVAAIGFRVYALSPP
jgi:hypothetical protein